MQIPYAPIPIPSQEPPSGGLLQGQLPSHLGGQVIGWFGPHGGGQFHMPPPINPGIDMHGQFPGGQPPAPHSYLGGRIDPTHILQQIYNQISQQSPPPDARAGMPIHPADIQSAMAQLAQRVAGARGKAEPRLRPIRTAPEPTQLFYNPTQHRPVAPPTMNPGMGGY